MSLCGVWEHFLQQHLGLAMAFPSSHFSSSMYESLLVLYSMMPMGPYILLYTKDNSKDGSRLLVPLPLLVKVRDQDA